jgi:hypothetical protein
MLIQAFNLEENTAIIGGTWYGGEMKKVKYIFISAAFVTCAHYTGNIFSYELCSSQTRRDGYALLS